MNSSINRDFHITETQTTDLREREGGTFVGGVGRQPARLLDTKGLHNF